LWGFNGHWYTREELIDFLSADQAAFRAAAARALAGLGPQASPAVAKLRRALAHDFDLTVRCRAAEALGRIGPAAAVAVEDLAQALWHPHRPLRLRAARALGRLGPAAQGALHDLCYFGRHLTDDRRLTRVIREAVYCIDPREIVKTAPG
jgi:HEAT repeat protein